MSFINKTEKTNTLFSFITNIHLFWVWIGGSSMLGGIFGYFSPLVNTLGKPLSIFLGAAIVLWLFSIIKEKLIPQKTKDGKNKNELTAVDILKKGLCPRDFIEKLLDDDVFRMAEGRFRYDKSLFEYNLPKGKRCVSECLPPDSNKYHRVNLYFLPKIAKIVNIIFEINPQVQEFCSFFIKNGNHEVEVNKYSTSIETELSQENFDYKYIEYRIDYDEKLDKTLWNGLIIYVKSFSI
ncbi:MAG: hypothetical protein WCW01_00295 [Gammaproteobacteria bacterium]